MRESKLRTGESWTARLLHAHHHHDDRTHDDDDVIDAGRDHHGRHDHDNQRGSDGRIHDDRDRRDNDRRGYHDRYRDDDCVPRRHHDDECRGEDFASEDHQAEERRPRLRKPGSLEAGRRKGEAGEGSRQRRKLHGLTEETASERGSPVTDYRQGGAGKRRLLSRPAFVVVLVIVALASVTPAFGEAARMPQRPDANDSIVAMAITRVVPIYRRPGARRPFHRLANPTPGGGPLVFLVRARGDGWEQVYLPIRPDGATGWIRDRYLTLTWNPYSLTVRLRAHELVVRKRGRVLARYSAGVGRSLLPTPRGRYYIVELLKQPDPNGPYGPYAFGTSAFSHVLYSYGGGRGQIGIHGTNDASSIGRSVSHGCIRIANVDMVRLAHELPLGTPVTIDG